MNSRPVVYVVDDESVIAETLALILSHAGFEALSFHDPLQALAAAGRDFSPDLLISDVMMPQMSGIELAIHFRQVHPKCEILLFSGQAGTAGLVRDARKDGHDFELLPKPIHPAELIARLDRSFPGRRSQNASRDQA